MQFLSLRLVGQQGDELHEQTLSVRGAGGVALEQVKEALEVSVTGEITRAETL